MRNSVRSVLVASLFAAGCSTSSKATVMEKGMAKEERRQELFEATLEVLDRNPEYVDEFFVKARKHPKTLNRFIGDQSAALDHDPELAGWTAEHLRAHPKALENTMIHTLDAVKNDPRGRRAVANAMKARASIAADIVVDEHDSLTALAKAMARKAKDDPSTRDNLKTAFKDVVSGGGDKGDAGR